LAQAFKAVYLGSGLSADYTPGAAVAAGEVVVQNSMPGFARSDIAASALGSLGLAGKWRIVKANGAINPGVAVYWDADGNPQGGTAGSGCATTTSTGNTFLGFAEVAAGASAEYVDVIVGAAPVTLQGLLQNAIADPGNGGAIPVTASGYVPIVTAGAETRTLAAPTFVGQELLIYIKTDGGTAVITVASAINQTGNNTITMAEVRDVIRLVAIESGANKVWHVVSNDGAALSTV
jgi:predicted RecA/RadA family phage recombinase